MELKEAIRILLKEEHLEDWIYDVRERTHEDSGWKGDSWEHPRVVRFGEVCNTLKEYLNA
jgi:hypothetical protein